jgi:polysaccharide export outer membrane protein
MAKIEKTLISETHGEILRIETGRNPNRVEFGPERAFAVQGLKYGKAYMLRSVVVVVALGWGLFPAAAAMQNENGIPTELQQYVRDAQKAGLPLPQIRQNAMKAGWPESTVEEALASARPVAKSDEGSKPPKVVKVDPPKEPAKEPPNAAAEPANEGGATAAGASNPAQKSARGDDYLIGAGDVLQISVWGEPTASVPVATVRTDGKISMPLIKEVQVAGLTPSQVENMVQEQLGSIIRLPDVTVIVAQINSKKIYLTGAVKREGPLKFTYRMTVLQAISEAGGLTDYAKRKEIYVLHSENGRNFKLPFNYTAVLKGEHMEQNILLSPGDTIVVP